MTEPYAKRQIDVSFQLGQGTFGDTGMNTSTDTGFRVSATITKAGAVGMNTLNLRIDGLTPTTADSISTLGKALQTQATQKIVKVSAGDETSGMSVAYIGNVLTAFRDFQGAPNAAVAIMAFGGLYDAMRPLPPTSVKGTGDVATMMSGLAKQMGYAFENNGVQVSLQNPYFPGTGRTQAAAMARAANINWIIDDGPAGGAQTLAIWNKGKMRGQSTPVISATTGMVGYPTWTDSGLIVKTIYNPTLSFGGAVEIQSTVKNANGLWTIFNITHELESEMPDGKWFTTLQCTLLGHQALA